MTNNLSSSTNNQIPNEYQSMQCLRIEENSHRVIFLYYKRYPKKNSERFPQNLSAIFFYFDHELDDKFFYLYLSLIGQVDEVELGSFFNRKGSKSKRRIVNFAIVKFLEEESMNKLLDPSITQRAINNYLENRKNKNIDLNYDPLKEIKDENEEKEIDDDGFVEVKPNTARKNFSKGGISFKIMKEKEEDEDILNAGRRNKKKKHKGNDFFWGFQMLDKKRQSKFIFIIFNFIVYDELKNLFEEDKKAINNKIRKIE